MHACLPLVSILYYILNTFFGYIVTSLTKIISCVIIADGNMFCFERIWNYCRQQKELKVNITSRQTSTCSVTSSQSLKCTCTTDFFSCQTWNDLLIIKLLVMCEILSHSMKDNDLLCILMPCE